MSDEARTLEDYIKSRQTDPPTHVYGVDLARWLREDGYRVVKLESYASNGGFALHEILEELR